MAISLGTGVWSAASTAAGNLDTSVTPAPPGGSVFGGVVVGIVQSASVSDLVTSVAYGIVAGAVPLGRGASPYGFASESAEAGAVYWYWAGDSNVWPSGAQTVRIVRTGTNRIQAVIWPLYVATGKVVALDGGATGTHTSTGSANPSWAHASLVNDVVAVLAIHSGNNTMTTTPATGWTRAAGNTASVDATATGAGWAERTLATAGALAPGWTDAAAEDWRGSSMSFMEATPSQAPSGTPPGLLVRSPRPSESPAVYGPHGDINPPILLGG